VVAKVPATEPAAVAAPGAPPTAEAQLAAAPAALSETEVATASAPARGDGRVDASMALSSSAMMVPASMGASVWPAAILAGEMPVELLRARVRASGARGQRGVTLVDLRR
jgi:hypothetical protein